MHPIFTQQIQLRPSITLNSFSKKCYTKRRRDKPFIWATINAVFANCWPAQRRLTPSGAAGAD